MTLKEKIICTEEDLKQMNNELVSEDIIYTKHNITIPNFEGPLDLLCFLISKNKMDILDISLSQITDEYIEYLNSMADMDMEVATEFLVMASSLLYLKSKKLLPLSEKSNEDSEKEDEITEEELLTKIAIYKEYKDKQELLKQMYADNFGKFTRLPEKINFKEKNGIPININILTLFDAYSIVMQRNLDKINKKAKEIEQIAVYERVTVKDKVKQIMSKLNECNKLKFSSLFSDRSKEPIDVVTAFLGMLELVRLKQITVNQNGLYEDIEMEKISDEILDLSLLKE